MKKYSLGLFCCITACLSLAIIQTSCNSGDKSSPQAKDMVLWYLKPGEKWNDGMLLGNGYMGANVFGRVQNERIALNESSFWSGVPHDYNNPEALKYFSKIKDLVFAEKFQEAEKMTDEHFWGIPKAQQAYQPLGDLLLNFKGGENIKDYYRELDMESGITKVTYNEGDTKFTREIFLSYPDRVLVVKISSNKPGKVSVEARLKSPFLDETIIKDNMLLINGTWKYIGKAKNDLIAHDTTKGLRFQTVIVAIPEKGELSKTDSGLVVSNANSVTFVLTAATSYINYEDISGDPAARCEKVLAGVNGKDFSALRTAHVADFSNLMGRVHLTVGDQMLNEKPTDERLANVKKGQSDPNLVAKIFQFGRYMLVSSSRIGGQPANLQAIWNEALLPPWGSKYTMNINTEMNYWPAEVTNLSETHFPLFSAIKDLSVNGQKTAKIHYGVGGWVVHHNFDLWRGTAPVDAARFGMWPIGGSWLCQHIWEHYAFTGDVEFLKEYYPVLKGSAQFLMELMVVEPKHNWLVIPFSMSPEQGYFDSKGKKAFLSKSTTMDIGIIRELFPHCIEASKILNVDQEFSAKLETALTKIPPFQLGKDSLLQVWVEDWKRGPEGHNMSANFSWYPGHSLTLRGNPKYAAAIQKWLEPRRGRGGWTTAWDICDWARLENGERADTVIKNFLRSGNRGGLGINLYNTGSNQCDANFGFTAAIAECLIQSHAGEISLLPALPPTMKDGSVTGLRARGGYEVSIDWKEGKLTKCVIKSLLGNPFVVRCNGKTTNYNVVKGETLTING
jgi:alpha-L-fucosidase 2